MSTKSYIVVPFHRMGPVIGPSQALVCSGAPHAQSVAQSIAPRVAGVVILAREIDPETGDDRDTIVAEFGAIPPAFPEGTNWTVRLN